MHVYIVRLQFAVGNVVVEEETVKKGVGAFSKCIPAGVIFGTHNEISTAHTKFTRGSLQFRAQL